MSKVILKECLSYQMDQLTDSINDGMNQLGGWKQFVRPGFKVLLKVNMISPKSSESAAITHSEFVRALVRILKKEGCEVWIGDSSGGAILGKAITSQSFTVSGYERMAEEEGAIIKNFDKEGVVIGYPSSPREPIYLAKPIYDANLVINLPKFKTHAMGLFTGAVKNVFGCIPGLRKAGYHKTAPSPREFGEVLADIHEVASFPLHIMDAVEAMQGEGPTAGYPYQASKILISTDALALDTVAVKMLEMNIKDLPIFAASIKRGIGESDLSRIKVEGDYSTIPKLEGFRIPMMFHARKGPIFRVLIPLIDFWKSRPVVNLDRCKHCNVCVESCPVMAIEKDSKRIDYGLCIECLCCHELCVHQAVDLKRNSPVTGFLEGLSRKVKP